MFFFTDFFLFRAKMAKDLEVIAFSLAQDAETAAAAVAAAAVSE